MSLKNLNLYFRKYYYAHSTLTIEHSYFIRLKTPEYFPLKLYVLRYMNWLITSIQWFKPMKVSRSYSQKYSPRNSPLLYTTTKSNTKSKHAKHLKVRLKILILILSKSLHNSQKSLSYNF
jgi:hypothetical protein